MDFQRFIKNLRRRECRRIFIDREKLFETFIELLKENDTEIKELRLSFCVDGYTEDGVDTGSISNELFTLFFEECLSLERCMFEGTENRRLCVVTESATTLKHLYCLGKAIVMSMISNGPTFPYLTRPCLEYMTGISEDDIDISLSDLPESSPVTKVLKKMTEASSVDGYESILELPEFEKEIKAIQFPQARLEQIKGDKGRLVREIMKWYCLGSRKRAMDHLKRGLNSLSFLDKAKRYHELSHALIYSPEYSFSKERLTEMLLPQLYELKHKDENQQHLKDLTTNCLLNLEDDQARDLFQFITGMRELPVTELKLKVSFNLQNPSQKLPRASACAQLLLIPLGNTSDKEFITSFQTALSHGRVGFGRI